MDEERAKGVEISSDGQYVLTWSLHHIQVWELASRQLLRTPAGVDFDVYHACLSPNGRYVLATGSSMHSTTGIREAGQ